MNQSCCYHPRKLVFAHPVLPASGSYVHHMLLSVARTTSGRNILDSTAAHAAAMSSSTSHK